MAQSLGPVVKAQFALAVFAVSLFVGDYRAQGIYNWLRTKTWATYG